MERGLIIPEVCDYIDEDYLGPVYEDGEIIEGCFLFRTENIYFTREVNCYKTIPEEGKAGGYINYEHTISIDPEQMEKYRRDFKVDLTSMRLVDLPLIENDVSVFEEAENGYMDAVMNQMEEKDKRKLINEEVYYHHLKAQSKSQGAEGMERFFDEFLSLDEATQGMYQNLIDVFLYEYQSTPEYEEAYVLLNNEIERFAQVVMTKESLDILRNGFLSKLPEYFRLNEIFFIEVTTEIAYAMDINNFRRVLDELAEAFPDQLELITRKDMDHDESYACLIETIILSEDNIDFPENLNVADDIYERDEIKNFAHIYSVLQYILRGMHDKRFYNVDVQIDLLLEKLVQTFTDVGEEFELFEDDRFSEVELLNIDFVKSTMEKLRKNVKNIDELASKLEFDTPDKDEDSDIGNYGFAY